MKKIKTNRPKKNEQVTHWTTASTPKVPGCSLLEFWRGKTRIFGVVLARDEIEEMYKHLVVSSDKYAN